jgi:regulator of protease activity HflC (stomatin/prohibitin superfamily)
LIVGGALALVLVVAFMAVFVVRIVPDGEVGIVHTFGEVDPEPRPPGIVFKSPVANLVTMDLGLQEFTVKYTSEEDAPLEERTLYALTDDDLTTGVHLTVRFRLEASRAPSVFRDVGFEYPRIILLPAIRGAIRETLARYTLEDLCGLKPDFVKDLLMSELDSDLQRRGLVAEQIQNLTVILPPEIRGGLERIYEAEQRIAESKAEYARRIRESAGEGAELPFEMPIPVPIDPFAPSDDLIPGCWR